MTLMHPKFAYDAQRNEHEFEAPRYMHTAFLPRRRGQAIVSASEHPFPLYLVESQTGEFSSTDSGEHRRFNSDSIIAGTVDLVDALQARIDETMDEGDPEDLGLWTRYGYTAVSELEPGRVFEAVAEGRLFRFTAARRLGFAAAWTAAIEELEQTGYWYRFTFASTLPHHATADDAVAYAVRMMSAHLQTTGAIEHRLPLAI